MGSCHYPSYVKAEIARTLCLLPGKWCCAKIVSREGREGGSQGGERERERDEQREIERERERLGKVKAMS